jgi:hypothetical protein
METATAHRGASPLEKTCVTTRWHGGTRDEHIEAQQLIHLSQDGWQGMARLARIRYRQALRPIDPAHGLQQPALVPHPLRVGPAQLTRSTDALN